ncbi:MAG TPA: glycosyltransferase family 87 protein, partial [Gemmatales bacterium]|nr:glycosyltransferase family 87 protein [Gemmatales bacterium]
CFPHHYSGILIGQNHTFTLLLLTAGWWLNKNNKPLLAGMVWGLLIYKPVFLVALILVPVALLRWKMLLGMVICAVALVLLTLPFTRGLEPWKRWITVGQRASSIYELDRRWVWLSRDLAGLPRRAMWDPQSFVSEWNYLRHNEVAGPDIARTYLVREGQRMRSPRWASMTGWLLLIGIAFVTLLVLWWRDQPDDADPLNIALLLTGSLWCVLHFMYYDQLVFALPIFLLLPTLGVRKKWWRVGIVTLLSLLYLSSLLAFWHGAWWLLAIPLDAFVLLLVWLQLVISAAFPRLSSKIFFFPTDYTP